LILQQGAKNVGLREKMNDNPMIATYATGAVIVLALILIIWQIMGGNRPSASSASNAGPGQAFFTTDDGATWFADEVTNLPPYTKDGKQAYQVIFFTCDGGKTTFVGYLQRYTPEAKKDIAVALKHGVPPGVGLGPNATEIKAPGTGDAPKSWLKFADPRSAKLRAVTCPGGGEAEPASP
jgi:hypothetical protein